MFQRLVLAAGFLVSLFIAVVCLAAPETALADFGITVNDPNGRNEMRGQYGGFFVAMALVMALSFFDKLPRRFGVGVLLTLVGGVLLGRLITLVLEGPATFADYSAALQITHFIDLGLTIGCVLALRTPNPMHLRSDQPPPPAG